MPTLTTNYKFAKPLINDPTDQDLWGGYLNTDLDSLDSIIFNLIPSGIVLPFAGASAPTGYLLCYGQAISRTANPALFTAIDTTYGDGDGSSTFNLPDLRGRSISGEDDMGGAAANRITSAISGIDGVTLGAVGGNQSLQSHNHSASVSDSGHAHVIQTNANTSSGGIGNIVTAANTGAAGSTFNSNAATTGISVGIGNTGAGSSQNMPPTMIMNFIIKT